MGAVAFDRRDPGQRSTTARPGPGFPIEVFNVLGAGDGFMSGLLKGWLDGEDWPTALKYANACGAFAVSRHGCTPAYPSWEELQFFLNRGVTRRRRCARMPRWSRCTGRPTATATGRRCGSSPSTTARSWKRCRGRDAGEDRRVQGAVPRRGAGGAGRPAGLWHALRRPAGPRRAVAGRRDRAVDRPAGRVAGLAAADAGAGARARISAGCRNGRWSMWSRCCASAIPTTTRRCGRRRRRRVTRLFHGGAPQPAGTAAGGDPVEGRRRWTTTTTAAGDRAVLRRRHLSRLVEAGADADRRRPGPNACAAIERARSAYAAASWCWGSTRPRRSWRRASRWRRGSRWSRVSRSGRTIFGEAARDWLAGTDRRCRGGRA